MLHLFSVNCIIIHLKLKIFFTGKCDSRIQTRIQKPRLFPSGVLCFNLLIQLKILFLSDSCLCRKVKTRGFLRNIPLSSFSFLCNEEICSISSNFTTALLFRPSAVKVALTSAVPDKLTYQSKVVSDVGVTLYTN